MSPRVPKNTVALPVATWNVGNGTLADAGEVMECVAAMALQEASDQTRMLTALDRAGYGVIRPTAEVGQAATPLVFDPQRLRFVRPVQVLLHPGGPIGPGTGPDHGKPKWLIGGRFVDRITGRHLAICGIHCYAGQRHDPANERASISREMVREAVNVLDPVRGLPILMGDFNALYDTPTVAPLRGHGWTCNHLVGGRVHTHGGWSPDHVWWRKDERIHFVEQRTIANRSDHDALIVTLAVNSRKEHH